MQLPDLLIQSLQQVKGFDEAAFIQVHQQAAQLTSVRKNPGKPFGSEHALFSHQLEAVPWSSNGYYLSTRPSFTGDPLFHAGGYYVQEASSMFLEEALRQTTDLSEPLKVLDLCAAPGGKSTLLQSIINAQSLLVSNEVIKTRANILCENITKWGAANVIVTNNDPKDFKALDNYFDVIVVDAPCSGSGLFRKDAAAIEEWSVNNVQLCSQRQQRILADIVPSLKEDGILVYSTCSYSEEEDEMITDWLTQELPLASVPLQVPGNWGIVETQSAMTNAFGYRFYPDKVKGEGFFIAAFKKQQATAAGKQYERRDKKQQEKIAKSAIEIVQPWLKDAENFFFIKQNETLLAIPTSLQEDVLQVQASLYIKKAGVKIGEVIRNELVPHHELAVSTIINTATAAVEVDKETALEYLRKQEIQINSNLKGWALINYLQLPLGWVKILPNRVNNYYPKEWRILNK